MTTAILDFFILASFAIIHLAGAAAIARIIKISGLGAWLANTWLGELTRPLWDIKDNK